MHAPHTGSGQGSEILTSVAKVKIFIANFKSVAITASKICTKLPLSQILPLNTIYDNTNKISKTGNL